MNTSHTLLKIFSIAAISTLFLANTGGTPGNRTGSAVDNGQTCGTLGGCHSNANLPILKQDLISTDIPASGYVAGKSYKITLSPAKDGAARWGFEMLVQNSSEEAVGSFTSNADGNIVSGNSDRITHKFASSSGGDTKTWVLDWTAPATPEGDLQIFASVLAANGNGNTGGDQLIIDTLNVPVNATASLEDFVSQDIVLYPNPVANELHLSGFDGARATISIFDMQGREVFSEQYTGVVNVRNLETGTYILKVANQNTTISKTFVKR